MHTNKIISFSLILISSLLYGCFGSSGVLPIGQGVYSLTVETPYIVGASGTKKKAIEEAQAYCVKQGKEVNILQYRGSSPAQNVFDMTFECLAPEEKSDRQVKPSPDAVIEVHHSSLVTFSHFHGELSSTEPRNSFTRRKPTRESGYFCALPRHV